MRDQTCLITGRETKQKLTADYKTQTEQNMKGKQKN